MQTMVRMGEIAISNTPGEVLVSLGLGSCIGLALVDRRAGAAGLAHIVLPETVGRPDAETAHRFADHAVPTLLDGLYELGASRVFTRAFLVGGASMFGGGAGAMDVGTRNASAVRELMAGRRIHVAAEAVGGTRGRTIRVDVASGGVTVREAGGTEQALLDPAGAEVAA
jgi:chemotaxis protein CheD